MGGSERRKGEWGNGAIILKSQKKEAIKSVKLLQKLSKIHTHMKSLNGATIYLAGGNNTPNQTPYTTKKNS